MNEFNYSKVVRLIHGLLERLPILMALALFAVVASQLVSRELDLVVYWQGAQQVFIHGVEPYTRPDGEGLPFTYPPTALFLFWPLHELSLEQAGQLLWTLNLALALVVLFWLPRDLAWTGTADPSSRMAGDRLRRWGPLYVASFGGLYLTLHFHQLNLLLLLCLWMYWRVLRRANAMPGALSASHWLGQLGAGAALAFGSVAKPHYGLLLLGAFGCLRRPSRLGPSVNLLIGAVVGGALLLILSLALVPSGSWSEWLAQVPGSTSYTALPPGHSSIAAPWNRSIAGEVARWLVPNKFTKPLAPNPELAALLTTAAVLLLTVTTGWALLGSLRTRARRCAAGLGPDPIAVDLELSLLSLWVFLAAPASWTHHLVMLLPAALVLLRDAVLDARASGLGRWAAGLVLMVLALTLDDLIGRDLRIGSPALLALMTIAVFGLWLLLLERLLRHRAQ
ncbi:MAG: DUF2029 domain-containing protein [Thiohalocapsa sp. PB-PSB1]|nr:MAG: DUF2029 domain-containing protein [Thiohalocapsa sp. PB-PSB1]